MADFKDTTNRHLRHKLQSLSRRLDELEEAASKLQKSEDELLDLQDKIIQSEGSSSALLNDVDALRKRVLKIEGKDEEVRKAEDLCRLVREKLEAEENLTKNLKSETEQLQRRMSELEKLEEAFSKSKLDCTQLCLSLNEEKNLTKKLSSELEALKARIKEVDSSESRLDKAEQALTVELEKIKTLTQTFVSERKRLLEKQREDEKLILELTEKLENNNRVNQSRNTSILQEQSTDTGDPRIEDDLSPGLTSKLSLQKKSFDLLKLSDDVSLRNKSENEKNSSENQEDNKLKDLLQENEKLKNIDTERLQKLEALQEDLKKTEYKNEELLEKVQQEKNRSKALNDQVEELKIQLGTYTGGVQDRVLENGKAENEEINVRGGFRQEKPKYRSLAESSVSRHKIREVSPQQRKEKPLRTQDLVESSPKSSRRALSPAHKPKKLPRTNPSSDFGMRGRTPEERSPSGTLTSTAVSLGDCRKPSVLSRYPPAANDQKPWKSVKPNENDKRGQADKFSRHGNDESSSSDVLLEESRKVSITPPPERELSEQSQDPTATSNPSKANGPYTAYRPRASQLLPSDQGSEGHSSASETESTGSRRSAGEGEPTPDVTVMSGRTTTCKYPRHTRLLESRSGGSSTRSSFEDDQSRPLVGETNSQELTHTPSGIEIRRVCSPREALMSKAEIKPAIVEIDKKELMVSVGRAEPLPSNGKPKISSKPSMPSKMTSSITIYPSDPSCSRSSSRSSSVSSEPARERHTSNIVITPSEHRGSISIPYEISIPKSEITLRPPLDSEDCDVSSVEPACSEAQTLPQRSFTWKSPEKAPDVNNDTESGFESSSSTGTNATVTSWRSHQPHGLRDDSLPEMKNVTVRSTWKKKGVASVDSSGSGSRVDGSEEEAESATTWRAYRATTVLDAEDAVTANPSATTTVASRTAKPSPAEVYMRKINSTAASKDVPEPIRRSRSSLSPTEGLKKGVPHEPVTAQELQPWHRAQSPALEETGDSSITSWRKQASGSQGSSGWTSKTQAGRERGPVSSRGQGGRPWSHRQTDN
ncbi:leucine zipper protein 1 [Brienomyrus brachyistius]|uniref:leucine zipper protein 1 n=1 Tax=Brienomyrus brachyistius TaxID=42636 RepID=UPI0020B297C3|nr:leucine zipper protein 1 [Brienomyrus brachyistius]